MRPEGQKTAPEVLNGLANSFELMKYDVGLLAKGEADAFDAAGIKAETWRKTAKEVSFTIVPLSSKKRGYTFR